MGIPAGYFGSWADEALMRITDAFLSFPSLVLAIAFTVLLGNGFTVVLIVLVIIWWPTYARYFRAQAIALRLNLFDADERLSAGHYGGCQMPRADAAPGEVSAALVELKRIFAKRYHPNSTSNGPQERAVRAELFKEFWGDIATVQAKYSRDRPVPEKSKSP